MDLYIQVGVLLCFLAALSLFIYIYTAPAQEFTQRINSTNQKVNARIDVVSGLDVAQFKNSTDTPGTAIYPLIRDAKANKIAVIVQTKNQQGLIVNYGNQLRSNNDAFVAMSPYGYAGVGGNTGTDFEKNFVSTVLDVFNTTATPVVYASGMAQPAATAKTFGSSAMFAANVSTLMSTLIPSGAQAPGYNQSGKFYMAPHLMLVDPSVPDASKAGALGRSFSSTGYLYTDQVLKTDAPVNDNFSYADAAGSLYKFNQSSAYYTTVILDATQNIVGIYVEEHGVDPKASVLGGTMLANGTITQLY
jgi:hypothetical protein